MTLAHLPVTLVLALSRWPVWSVLALFDSTIEKLVPYGEVGIILVGICENVLLPTPPETLQVPLTLLDPSRAWYYAGICMFGVLIGSVIGYLIGLYAGERVFTWIIRKGFMRREDFDKARDLLLKYDLWSIFIVALTPIPNGVFTIAAGISKMPLWRLLLGMILGRSPRFILVAWVLATWGDAAKEYLTGLGFDVAMLIAGVLVVGIAFLVYRIGHREAVPEAG